MKSSTEKALEALQDLKTFLDSSLQVELGGAQAEYEKLVVAVNALITQAQEKQNIINKENWSLREKAKEKYGLNILNGKPYQGEDDKAWFAEAFKLPGMKSLVEAANKRMEPIKKQREALQIEEQTLRKKLQALPHQENIRRLSNQLKERMASLHDTTTTLQERIPQDPKATITGNQEFFIRETKAIAKEAITSLELVQEAFDNLHEQKDDTQAMRDELDHLITRLTQAYDLIKGEELNRLGSLLQRYEQQRGAREETPYEVSFADIDYDAFDDIIIDTSFIIDIHQLINNKNVTDHQHVLPPPWLAHKRLLIPEKVISEIEGDKQNPAHKGLLERKSPLITKEFWNHFKTRWHHHLINERIRDQNSDEIMDLLRAWWDTPKGKEHKNQFGGFESKEYFLSTADLNICLYTLKHHHKNILIAAWDEDINKLITHILNGKKHGRIGYLTSRNINLVKKAA